MILAEEFFEPATRDDLPLLLQWNKNFVIDTHLTHFTSDDIMIARLEKSISEKRQWFLKVIKYEDKFYNNNYI